MSQSQTFRRLILQVAICVVAVTTFPAQPAANRVQSQPAEIWEEIAPGVEFLQTIRGLDVDREATGPWVINLLRLDPNLVKLRLVHAMDEGVGLETVSSMAARYGALAAVNGGYFRTSGTYRGDSIGVLMLNGTLVSEPYNERAAVGLLEREGRVEAVFGHLKFEGKIASPGFKHQVDGINRPLNPDELIVFTPQFHRSTLTSPNGAEVIVRGDRTKVIRDLNGSTNIPQDGFVISTEGNARNWVLKTLRVGSRVTFSWKLHASDRGQERLWRLSRYILGGGPQLIRDGKTAITNTREKIPQAFVTDRHPRTAIARLRSGKLLLATIDGRQPGVSVGMSLNELAGLLLEFDATDAINLDGGGSTTMVVRNKVINKPSDQTGERPVSDAILVFSKRN